jgi:hypothetical protein
VDHNKTGIIRLYDIICGQFPATTETFYLFTVMIGWCREERKKFPVINTNQYTRMVGGGGGVGQNMVGCGMVLCQ